MVGEVQEDSSDQEWPGALMVAQNMRDRGRSLTSEKTQGKGVARLVLLILALLVAFPLLVPVPTLAKTAPQGLAGWPEGPVRYLLARSEEEEFRKLQDVTARALFIVRFWRRRDPTPGTLENETRREFWRRVLEANRRFKESVRPGWMTERGRIFIQLGEPDQEQVDERGGIATLPGRGSRSHSFSHPDDAASDGDRIGGEDTSERGLLRWIYRNLPSRKTDPETIFAFTRDASGEWRLSQNPDNYSPVLPGLAVSATDPTFGGMSLQTAIRAGASASQATGGGASAVADELRNPLERVQQTLTLSDAGRQSLIALDLAEATLLPRPGETGPGIVTASEFLGRLPVSPRFAFFRAADGNTQVRVGVSILAREIYKDPALLADLGSFLLVYARFTPSGGAESFFLSNESSPVPVGAKGASGADLVLEAWAARTIPPGSYEVAVGLEDAATGQVSSLRQTLEVPNFSKGSPVLSSIIPVSHLEQRGGELVEEPRVSTAFRRDEEFGIYYQVYNLKEQEGGPSFDLTYRLFLRNGAEEHPVGKPIVRSGLKEPVQGWSFPLEKWPSGSYRLEVTVNDHGSQASGSLNFEVL